jgi:hypothetical protein
MEMRFRKLKREFYAPPTPETAKREKILTSTRNIAFLYLEAKLLSEGLIISQVIPKFDKDKKGKTRKTDPNSLCYSLTFDVMDSRIERWMDGCD